MSDFKIVRILKGEEGSELGIGSYGAVYKARCDDVLLCAAKVLHPALFQTNDPAFSTILTRFRQECDFLKSIKHPNVVQFLGVYDDPQFKQPVLLMELVDSSLTKFLNSRTLPLPIGTQVSFTHDIAVALAYLHSKKIVHRDLSSNNVLIVAGSKAKVTDFGMSKLLGPNTTRRQNLTFCPGTEVYMPPEALTEPPEYTYMLDCFSLGPLMIQIITRLFPDPGPRKENIDDPSSPSGSVERPILETVRRESHLELIGTSHPLLEMIHRCLSFKPKDRPSAVELCHQLEKIKVNADTESHDQTICATIQCECGRDTQAINDTIQWECGQDAPCDISPGSITTHKDVVYVQKWRCTKVYSLETKQNKWTELKDCQKMGTALVVINELLTVVGGYRQTDSENLEFNTLTSLNTNGALEPEWVEKFPPMPTKRYNASAIQSNSILIVSGGLSDSGITNNVEILHTNSNPEIWFSAATTLPITLYLHSTAICGNQLYLISGPGTKLTETIYCELDTLLLHCVPAFENDVSKSSLVHVQWHKTSTLPVYKSTVCTLGEKLLAIGGVDPACQNRDTTKMFCYRPSSNTWMLYGEMPCAQSSCLAAVVEKNKVVILKGRSTNMFVKFNNS